MRPSRSVTALALGLALCTTDLAAQVKARLGVAAGHVFVECDKGTFPVAHVSGGNVVGTVAENAGGPGGKRTKRIVGSKIEPLVIEADPVVLLPWIGDLGKDPQKRVNCSVVYSDFNGKVQSRLVVSNALISRVEFDAFDAGSKDTLSVRVSLDPERITEDTKGGDVAKAEIGKHKAIPVANFRLGIPGVDTNGVRRIGPLVYTCRIASDQIGANRDPVKHVAEVTFENVTLEVAEARATGFVEWHRMVVVDGKRDATTIKAGTLEVLGPDLKNAVLKIEISGAQILAARRQDSENTEAVRSRAVELLVDGWTIGG